MLIRPAQRSQPGPFLRRNSHLRCAFSLVCLIALFGLIAIIGSPPALAQSCPPGSLPLVGPDAGWHGCSPAADDSDAPDDAVWEDRWGAMAMADGAFGAVEGAVSKAQAESIALQRCNASEPGAKCWVKIAYYNQCAAIAWGDGGATAFRGPDIEEDKAEAIKSCSKHTTNCRTFYAACSGPERVR